MEGENLQSLWRGDLRCTGKQGFPRALANDQRIRLGQSFWFAASSFVLNGFAHQFRLHYELVFSYVRAVNTLRVRQQGQMMYS